MADASRANMKDEARPNFVYIGRAMPWRHIEGSPWGNPFKVKDWGIEASLRHYRTHILGKLLNRELDIRDLDGKTLVCWCRAGEPCHADVLIDLIRLLPESEG